MSNSLAVATATAALSQLLREPIVDEVSGADVTIARPHAATDGTTPEAPSVNLYLYQLTPNPAWRNADLPTRGASSELRQRPRAAFDLHYLLTFYGNAATLEPERLLGVAARTLHERPVLTRDLIRATIQNPSFPFLAGSDLADDIELVKFSPIAYSLEELSKLWSVFLQTSYTLSMAYQGTVVLIESEVRASAPLPVRERKLYVMPFRQPVIERVKAEDAAGAPIDAADPASTLVIQGRQLRGDITQVRIAGVDVALTAAQIGDSAIRLPVSAVPAAGLRAGVLPVQVIHQLALGSPPQPHAGYESNAAALVLNPIITASLQTSVGTVTVTVTANPPVGPRQRAVLALNQLGAEPPASYSFVAPARTDATDTLMFDITGAASGEYLVRLQVDGAASALQVQNGQYTGPKVTVP